jgi:hypothetical protein
MLKTRKSSVAYSGFDIHRGHEARSDDRIDTRSIRPFDEADLATIAALVPERHRRIDVFINKVDYATAAPLPVLQKRRAICL